MRATMREPFAGHAARCVACGVLFGVLWLAVSHHWRRLDAADTGLLLRTHRYGEAHPVWVAFWQHYSAVLSPTTFGVLAGLSAVVAIAVRALRAAIAILTAMFGADGLAEIVKSTAQRQRPTSAFVSTSSWSFPSGHATAVMAGVVVFVALWRIAATHRWIRRAVAVVGAAAIVSVGLARVFVNAHYPSDVLAGWLLGLCWTTMCLLLFRMSTPVNRRAPDPLTAQRANVHV